MYPCVLQINQDCGYFEWLDPKMYSFGQKVVHRLYQRHEDLEAQAKRCETLVEVEVRKVRVEMESQARHMKEQLLDEISQYHKQIKIGDVKMHAMKKNYQTIIVCSWIVLMFALCMVFFGYTPNGHNFCKLGRIMLS